MHSPAVQAQNPPTIHEIVQQAGGRTRQIYARDNEITGPTRLVLEGYTPEELRFERHGEGADTLGDSLVIRRTTTGADGKIRMQMGSFVHLGQFFKARANQDRQISLGEQGLDTIAVRTPTGLIEINTAGLERYFDQYAFTQDPKQKRQPLQSWLQFANPDRAAALANRTASLIEPVATITTVPTVTRFAKGAEPLDPTVLENRSDALPHKVALTGYTFDEIQLKKSKDGALLIRTGIPDGSCELAEAQTLVRINHFFAPNPPAVSIQFQSPALHAQLEPAGIQRYFAQSYFAPRRTREGRSCQPWIKFAQQQPQGIGMAIERSGAPLVAASVDGGSAQHQNTLAMLVSANAAMGAIGRSLTQTPVASWYEGGGGGDVIGKKIEIFFFRILGQGFSLPLGETNPHNGYFIHFNPSSG